MKKRELLGLGVPIRMRGSEAWARWVAPIQRVPVGVCQLGIGDERMSEIEWERVGQWI